MLEKIYMWKLHEKRCEIDGGDAIQKFPKKHKNINKKKSIAHINSKFGYDEWSTTAHVLCEYEDPSPIFQT